MGKKYPQIQNDIGGRIRELREKAGHTQESLALKSGLDRTYINSVENGRRNISVQALEKIILALDCTFKRLFSYELYQVHPPKNVFDLIFHARGKTRLFLN